MSLQIQNDMAISGTDGVTFCKGIKEYLLVVDSVDKGFSGPRCLSRPRAIHLKFQVTLAQLVEDAFQVSVEVTSSNRPCVVLYKPSIYAGLHFLLFSFSELLLHAGIDFFLNFALLRTKYSLAQSSRVYFQYEVAFCDAHQC